MSRRRNRLDAGQLRPCRTADSISLSLSLSLSLALALSLFLSYFRDSVRAYNYRRHASPRTLLERAMDSSHPLPRTPDPLSRASPPGPLYPALRRPWSLLVRRFANARKKPRLSVDLLGSYTGSTSRWGEARYPITIRFSC